MNARGVLRKGAGLVLSVAALLAAAPAAQAAVCPGSDEFAGDSLSDAIWSSFMRENRAGYTVADGAFNVRVQGGDYHAGNGSARNTPLQDAPSGPWTATVKVDISELDGTGQQAGLVVWAAEGPNTFAKLVYNRRTGDGSGNAGWFERVHTVDSSNQGGFPNTGVVEEATGDVWVRASSDGAAQPTITPEYSVDGENWSPLGDPFQMTTNDLKLGPTAFAGGDTANWVHFDFFHIEAADCRPDVALSADPQSGAEPLEVEFTAELTDDVDEVGDLDVEWDFGDGNTAAGGASQTHTYTAPGTYRATVTATDSAGNVAIARADVTVGAPQATCGTDDFDGSALDPIWDVLRPFEWGPRLANGALELEIAPGDMIQGTATARDVVLKDAPSGGWQATTSLDISEIDANGEQAGLVIWQSEGPPSTDNYFSKAVFVQSTGGNRQFEHIATERGDLARPISASITPAPEELPADAQILLRATSDGAWITTEFSDDDGANWTQIGMSRYFGGDVKVGLKASDNDTLGGVAYFDYFTLLCGPEAEVIASPDGGDAPLEVDLDATVTDDADEVGDLDLAWDFGDGNSAAGGTEQTHVYTEAGAYRPTLTATDSDGIETAAASDTVIVEDPAQDPCVSDLSDEFSGNALDPKWDALRSMPSGRSVADGALQLQTYSGDMHGNNASARNVLLQDAPNGEWTATTRIDVSDLTQQGDQVGVILWRSEGPNNFAKVVFNKRGGSDFWFERSNTNNGSTSGGNAGILSNPPQHVYIRVHSDGGANPTLAPEYSLDGENWTAIHDPFQVGGEGKLRIGLTYFQGGATRVAKFDWFRLEFAGDCEPTGACTQAIADDFDGTELGAGWTVLRPAGDGPEVADGNLNLEIRSGDFINTNADAENVVMRPAPSGGWTATTEFNIAEINENGEQAGMVVWASEGPPATDNVFGKATFIQTNNGTRQFEFLTTEHGSIGFPTGSVSAAPAPDGLAADADVQLRLRSDGRVIVAEFSADEGDTWTKIGQHGTINGPVQVGMLAIRGGNNQTGGIVPFRSFAIECGPDVELTATPQDGDAPLEVAFEATADDDESAPNALDIEWDFGDGETASGGLEQTHTYTEPGTYEASAAVTDGDGNTTRERILVQVADPNPDNCLFEQSDEFSGNALDPKWDVLRPVESGLTLAGGKLRLKAYGGDMHSNNASARNVLLQDVPTEPHVAETAVDVTDLTSGGDQAGIVVWRGEDPNNFAKLVFNRRASGAEGNFWIERANTVDGSAQGENSGMISGAGVETVLLRTISDGAADPTFTAEYSLNGGNTWSPIADAFQLGGEGQVRIGITYFRTNAMQVAEFDYFRVSQMTCGAPVVSLNAEPQSGDAPLEVDFTATATDDFDDVGDLDIEWDFGDGDTASGGLEQTHIYEDAGTYQAQISVTDTDDNTTTRSVEINVTEECAVPGAPEPGFTRLWDGVSDPTDTGWTQSGPGSFEIVNDGQAEGCRLLSNGGLGLLWFSDQQFTDFVLRLQWRAEKDIDNSGVFVRFPAGGANTHQTAINQGYEVQIREGVPNDGENQKTGSIYNFKRETERNANPSGEWNDYEIRVTGSPPRIQVTLNGMLVNDFQGTVTNRGMAPGYIGLQNHGAIDEISFRNIRIQELEPVDDTAPVTEATLDPASPDGNAGWYRTPVEVTLDATDEGGAGVESTEYALDGGDFVEYEGPFTVGADGEHVVEFRSTDGADNVEETKSVEFKIDRNAPVTTPLLESDSEPGEDGYTDPVTVTLDGDDGDGSGVAATEYRILPSGVWVPYEGALEFVAAGEYEIEFRSTDAAGNREVFSAVRFAIRQKIDTGEDMALAVKPAKKRIGAGKRVRFRTTLSAGAEAPGNRAVTLCVKVQKKRFRVIGKRCVDLPSLAPASELVQRFVLKAKKRARGKKSNVRFIATSPGIRTLKETAVVRVRKR